MACLSGNSLSKHDNNIQNNVEKIMRKYIQNQNFKTSFLVDKSPKNVFNAINKVPGWWSGEIKGRFDKLDSEFTYSDPDVHYSRQKISEFVHDKKIVWHVLDASLTFVKNRDEWKGSDIIFEIEKKDDKTELRFTHKRLVPEFDCYDSCSRTWDVLVNGNLRNLIITGKDQPSPW